VLQRPGQVKAPPRSARIEAGVTGMDAARASHINAKREACALPSLVIPAQAGIQYCSDRGR